MTRPPLLSIVIATKNRERYCIEAVKSILSIPTDLIEITIADNSATEDVGKFIAEKLNDNVVYRYDNSEISSIENFNRAMELATGEYVCLIGDDDTVLPVILDAVKWAKAMQVDSLNSINNIAYYWPNALQKYPGGFLEIPAFQPDVKKIDAGRELEKLLDNGFVNYLLYPMPKTYHGLVKRDIMLKIKEITGYFYGGLSPDIYSVVALSCFVKKHYVTTIPLTIAGVCATSTTADNLTGRHSGDLEDMPHLKNRGPYVWDNNIPAYYSVPTIWAESALKALSDLGRTALYNRFNRYPLLAQGVLNNRKHILPLAFRKTRDQQLNQGINRGAFWFRIGISSLNLLKQKFERTIHSRFRTDKPVSMTNVVNIQEASNKTETNYATKATLASIWKVR